MKPFDNRHCDLKLKPATTKLHEETGRCWSRASAEVKERGNHARLYPAFIECHVSALRRYLEDIDSACRLVWLSDGNAITADFIRTVVIHRVFSAIGARMGSVQEELRRRVMSSGEHNTAVQHHLVQLMNQLKEEFTARYEDEAIELEKSERRKSDATAGSVAAIPQDRDAGREMVMKEKTPTDVPTGVYKLLKLEIDQEQSLRNYLVEHGIAPTPEVLASFAEKGAQPAQGIESNSAERAVYSWRAFHERFMQLADKQKQIVRTTRRNFLEGSCSYADFEFEGDCCVLPTLESAKLELNEGPDEHLKAQFEALATAAGKALGCPRDVQPLKFWLYRLFMQLREAKSKHVFVPIQTAKIGTATVERAGGIITDVCEASAIFCSRLERKALEQSEREDGPPPESLRAGIKQVVSPRAEVNSDTAQPIESKPTGRPRKDAEREEVRALRAEGKSWKEIAAIMNAKTGQNKNSEAYRSLLKSPSGAGKKG